MRRAGKVSYNDRDLDPDGLHRLRVSAGAVGAPALKVDAAASPCPCPC
jgi:hypothetical protein